MGRKLFILSGTTIAGAAFVSHVLRKKLAARRQSACIDCDAMGVISGQWSPYHWLAYHGHGHLLRLLLRILRGHKSHWTSCNAMATENRWTPLHAAATIGNVSAVAALLDFGASIDVADANGHTSLAIAVARGHESVVHLLLAGGAATTTFNGKKATPLHAAAMRGEPQFCSLLLDHKAQLNVQDSGGWTPLLVACANSKRRAAVSLLLERGAEAGASTYGQSMSSLMLVASWEEHSAEAAALLVESHADLAAVDTFGQTALHHACRQGRTEMVKVLCEGGAPTAAQDNDGQYPLTLICECCARAPDNKALVDDAMGPILSADNEATQRLDFSDSTALHCLLNVAGVHKSAPLLALNSLLAARADPTTEDDSGFTAVHYAAALQPAHAVIMLEALRKSTKTHAEFWASVDFSKKRDMSNRKYLMRRGGHHRIPLETRDGVLGGAVSLSGIVRRIREGRSRQIVVLVGAGASTAAGVPDFRSPMGLWSDRATRDLFSLDGFLAQPDAFWQKSSELFTGRQPTKTHHFLGRLAREGLLRRIYTQNIDGLEAAAGVPTEKIIECHGSATRLVCSHDRSHAVDSGPIQFEQSDAWVSPRCACGALLRPDMVFFGEPLPSEFFKHSGEDMHECDLLIVIGTALSVYPVAGLVNRVQALTPRLLINREAVGAWRSCESNPENYRDVFWKGECDAGADEFLHGLGWHTDS